MEDFENDLKFNELMDQQEKEKEEKKKKAVKEMLDQQIFER